jgi:hypothetical protein
MVTAQQLLTDAGFSIAFPHLETWFRRERINNPELQTALAREVIAQTTAALEHLSRPQPGSLH